MRIEYNVANNLLQTITCPISQMKGYFIHMSIK